MPRLIRVSTRATGKRETVRVYIYEDLDEMQAAAARFCPDVDFSDAVGACQTYDHDPDDGRAPIIIRLWTGALTINVITHEIAHAAVELYGRTLAHAERAKPHFDVTNETIAYLIGDLCGRLGDRLWALGYYERDQ